MRGMRAIFQARILGSESSDLPPKHSTCPMYWMNQIGIRAECASAECDPTGREDLEGLYSGLHGQSWVIESVDQNCLASVQTRLHELYAISERAPVVGIRRQNVHEHVVVRLPVISHKPQHFHFCNSFPMGRATDARNRLMISISQKIADIQNPTSKGVDLGQPFDRQPQTRALRQENTPCKIMREPEAIDYDAIITSMSPPSPVLCFGE